MARDKAGSSQTASGQARERSRVMSSSGSAERCVGLVVCARAARNTEARREELWRLRGRNPDRRERTPTRMDACTEERQDAGFSDASPGRSHLVGRLPIEALGGPWRKAWVGTAEGLALRLLFLDDTVRRPRYTRTHDLDSLQVASSRRRPLGSAVGGC
ncbi:hypothetical protein Micbo1qcDRAFT_170731 [Microdochium bolleyi]|uniref:Uncharacterized protein n=1 Tax=Microdochium bolleyi TaxID=196109 RepID=A0A136JIL0_9PEZI|nr:hypothetical protein Micbo1qcDRAFT_170731 [Microdochium bolleyi]